MAKTFSVTVLPLPPASSERAGRAERGEAGQRCRDTPSPWLLVLMSSAVPPSSGSPGQGCPGRSGCPAVPPLLRKLFIRSSPPAAALSLNTGTLRGACGTAQEPSPGPVTVQALQDPKPSEMLLSRKPSVPERAEHPQPPFGTAWRVPPP